jgi:hypothetical protein
VNKFFFLSYSDQAVSEEGHVVTADLLSLTLPAISFRILDLIENTSIFTAASLLLSALSGVTAAGYTTAIYALVPTMFPNDVGKSSVSSVTDQAQCTADICIHQKDYAIS